MSYNFGPGPFGPFLSRPGSGVMYGVPVDDPDAYTNASDPQQVRPVVAHPPVGDTSPRVPQEPFGPFLSQPGSNVSQGTYAPSPGPSMPAPAPTPGPPLGVGSPFLRATPDQMPQQGMAPQPAGYLDPSQSPDRFSFTPMPLPPNAPPPLTRNLPGEGRGANRAGLWSALGGALLGGLSGAGVLQGAASGYVGGMEGGLAAGGQAFTEAQRQQAQQAQADQMQYAREYADAQNQNQGTAFAMGREQQDQQNQRYDRQFGLQEKTQERLEGQAEAQQRQVFYKQLYSLSDDQARARLEQAEASGELSDLGLDKAFRKNPDGTFDVTGIPGRQTDEKRGDAAMKDAQAGYNKATTPQEQQFYADRYAEGYALAHPGKPIPRMPVGGGLLTLTADQQRKKADTDAMMRYRYDVQGYKEDHDKTLDEIKRINAEANTLRAESAKARTAIAAGKAAAAGSITPDKLNKATTGYLNTIARTQGDINRLTRGKMVPLKDKNGHVLTDVSGYPQMVPGQEDEQEYQARMATIEAKKQVIAASQNALAAMGYQSPSSAPIPPNQNPLMNSGGVGVGAMANPGAYATSAAPGGGGAVGIGAPPNMGNFAPGAKTPAQMTGVRGAASGPPVDKVLPTAPASDWRSYPVGTAFVGKDGRQWTRTQSGVLPAGPSPLLPNRPTPPGKTAPPGKAAPAKKPAPAQSDLSALGIR